MLIALITLAAFIFLALRPGSGGAVIPLSGDTSVVVAKVDIPARATIAANQLTVAKLNSRDVPPQSFSAVADVTGKASRFALIEIKAGQPVLANAIATSTDLVGAEPSFLPIPQGFVAMTIPTSEQQGVAGSIQPGDYIGIIATVDKGATTTSRRVKPADAGGSAARAGIGPRRTAQRRDKLIAQRFRRPCQDHLAALAAAREMIHDRLVDEEAPAVRKRHAEDLPRLQAGSRRHSLDIDNSPLRQIVARLAGENPAMPAEPHPLRQFEELTLDIAAREARPHACGERDHEGICQGGQAGDDHQ